jgi:hypothetical protein
LVLKGIFELCASKNVYVDEIQYVKSLKNHSHKMSSTCVEATKWMYAPDLEAMKVDISTTASVTDNENTKCADKI